MSGRAVDIDAPDHAERVIAAMQQFMATRTTGGVFHDTPGGADLNAFPGPVASADEAAEVIVKFDSADQFREVHMEGSRFEDMRELDEVDVFNNQKTRFRAWPLVALPSGEDEETWVVLVQPQVDASVGLPNVGETCQLRVMDEETREDISMWWLARRLPNNFGKIHSRWARYAAFSLTLSRVADDAASVIHPLVPHDKSQQENLAALELTADNSICVGLFLSKSSATFDAEVAALNRLYQAVTGAATASPERGGGKKAAKVPEQSASPVKPKQVAAFRYLLNFEDPAFTVSMFEHFPHMQGPLCPDSGFPGHIWEKYNRLNEDQIAAYRGLLSKMPCGVGMLPGGPGGGKTDWAMTVIGLMQSKTKAKVLYLLDINDPLDDATIKYMDMMKAAGLDKKAIRMRNFGTELRRSVHIGPVQNRAQNANRGSTSHNTIKMGNTGEPEVDFSKNFLKLYMGQTLDTAERSTHHQRPIVTLDESAWEFYEENKADFEKLTEQLEKFDGDIGANGAIRREIFQLYKTVLREADFVATTPCVAASAFKSLFTPDLIVFDEAAHARELSTLIAIANFCPTVGWLFIGDHRQTQPMVKSHNVNPYAKQLATSAMERAHLAGALDYQLLINHRAYGRLERLPSKLIYDGKMISGIPFDKRFPPCTTFVRDFFDNICDMPLSVPRLIIHLLQADRPTQVGTSWYHQQHTDWTMKRVLELVQDRRFRSAGNTNKRGTILLLAPYKAAVTKYQEAIEILAAKHPNLNIPSRVEARTWDSAQGHEADIVGIDYVRDHPTDFMDNMFRFNVGLTRARQGEWHLMHPRMPTAGKFQHTHFLRKLYSACNVGLGGLSEGRVVRLSRSDWINSIAKTPPEYMTRLTSPPMELPTSSTAPALAPAPSTMETTEKVLILANRQMASLVIPATEGSSVHEELTSSAKQEAVRNEGTTVRNEEAAKKGDTAKQRYQEASAPEAASSRGVVGGTTVFEDLYGDNELRDSAERGSRETVASAASSSGTAGETTVFEDLYGGN